MRRFIPPLAIAVAIVVFLAVSASGAASTTVSTRSTPDLGRILVNGKGVTLYLFEKDTKNKSNCSGACAANWPPLMAKGRLVARRGVKKSHLGSIKRPGGRQVTYFGHPVYRYIGDGNKAGRTSGEGLDAFGAEWYVLGTNGKKIEDD